MGTSDLHDRFLQFAEHARLKGEGVAQTVRKASFGTFGRIRQIARCSIDFPIINSPIRFITCRRVCFDAEPGFV